MDDGAAPFVLAERLQLQQQDDYEIEYEVLVDAQRVDEQLATVDAVVDAVAHSATAVQDGRVFDQLQSCVKHVGALQPEACHKLVDAVLSGMHAVLAARDGAGAVGDEALAEALARYGFLLQWLVIAVERHRASFQGAGAGARDGAGRRTVPRSAPGARGDAWSWASSLPAVLATMAKALRGVSEATWSSAAVREAFVARCILRPVMVLQENEAYFRVPAIKRGMFHVVCLAVKLHQQGFNTQTSIAQSLQYYEHLAEPMAELLALMRTEYDFERLCDDVLRDIAAKSFTALDSRSPRSFGRFLVRMAELSPRSVLRQMSLLQKHLDSESYPIRVAMVEVQGLLVRELCTAGDALTAHDDPDVLAARAHDVDAFTAPLFERFLDLTTFVRSKAMQVCSGLCDLPATLAPQRLQMASLAGRALEDKGSNVRRNAIALLTKLVVTHPYGVIHGGDLDGDAWRVRCAAVRAEVEGGVARVAEEGGGDGEGREDGACEERGQGDHRDHRDARLVHLRLALQYHEEALAFITQLEQGVPTLVQLLASTAKGEVLESMEFFRVARDYRIRGADAGVRAMVHLIWAKDNSLVMEDGSQLKGIRSRLIEVYRALYIDAYAALSDAENAARVARNMMELTDRATLAELTSLEQLFNVMYAERHVGGAVLDMLWDVYATAKPISKAQRRSAITVLGMLATADRDIAADKIDVLLRVGLGPLGVRDLTLAKYTCIALQRVSGSAKKVKGALSDTNVRYPMSHPMFARLSAMVCMRVDVPDPTWFSVAENAIQAIYLLGEQPDALATEMIRRLTLRALGGGGGSGGARGGGDGPGVTGDTGNTDGPGDTGDPDSTDSADTATAARAFHVAQLLFAVGHVALKQIVYLELVERELKRRKALRDAADSGSAKHASGLDQVAGSAEDEIGETTAFVKDRELLHGPHSLLALYGPMVAHICASPAAHTDAHVRRAAALTMGKLMCISSEYCEAHLALLLHTLKTSDDAVVRANVVIGLGDVAICFGTLVDENSERLYAGLGDPDLVVKKNTLMVLTHLILNGMIKVKGQLGELAKCLEDDEPRVSDLAKLFFSELATKENAVYNNLPDIISHLSYGEHAVAEDVFTNTMKFIFTFIDKERQAENVVEKLCQRFRLTTEERQWRDIAYCLSLLPYRSERSVRKLVDALPLYQDKLFQPEVYKRFTEILGKMRAARTAAAAKAGDTDLREFEDALAQAAAKGQQDQALSDATNAQMAMSQRRV
ncbi:condensin complex non-SMC subunit Cnd1 [Malassezia sp. CBS 17886]|nr:condensin complex non-SMC subunit Cnd1 [Malassezia sp. CBS 17886]